MIWRHRSMVTWLQVMLQFKMQLPNLTQPSLVERINFLSGQEETDWRVFSSCYLYAFVWKCSHLLYWTWQKGSPSLPLLLSSSGRTSLHLSSLGWWKASTSKAGLSWSPVLLWLFDNPELYHLAAVEVHPCGGQKCWWWEARSSPRQTQRDFRLRTLFADIKAGAIPSWD